MPEPEARECCATTADCHHLDDCADRPAAEYLGRFQGDGGGPSSPEKGHAEVARVAARSVRDYLVGWCCHGEPVPEMESLVDVIEVALLEHRLFQVDPYCPEHGSKPTTYDECSCQARARLSAGQEARRD